jgi:hypothetical protein
VIILTIQVKNGKIIWFCVLASLIIFSNYALYRFSAVQPLPEHIALASLFDLMLILPLTAYFFIFRKRYSFKYFGLVVLLGYGLSLLIIPDSLLAPYPFVPYMVGALEGVFLILELYLLFRIIVVFPRLLRDYRILNQESSYFRHNFSKSVEKHLPRNRVMSLWTTEFSLFYYALFSWGKKVRVNEGRVYSYHQKTSAIAVYIMLIHATLIETLGLHYFLHQWNPILSFVLLFLNVYGILFFLAEIQAIRLAPFLLRDDWLLLQVGITKSIVVPLSNIATFAYYNGPEKFTAAEQKTLFDARAADFIMEKPTFEIVLKEPQNLQLMYGLKKPVNRIVLNIDDAESFQQQLKSRLKEMGTGQ